MPGDGMEPRPLRQFTLDIGDQRRGRLLRRREAGILAEKKRIDSHEPPRLLIPRTAHHHAVDVREVCMRGLDAADAAVENDNEARMCALQPEDARIVEWRNLPVLLRRQAFEPRLAGMHDKGVGAGRLDRAGKSLERLVRILVVDAQPAFYGDADRDRSFHLRHALGHECGLRHQAGAEAPLLYAIRGAADVEIDLVETEVRADARAGGKRARIAAAELESERMLGRIVAQEPRAVAVQHRAGGQHLRIEQRPARQQPMEEPAVPVGPFHHRSDMKIGGTDSACDFSGLSVTSLISLMADVVPFSAHFDPFSRLWYYKVVLFRVMSYRVFDGTD